MPRPVKYDTASLLRAAGRLAAAGGPRAVTMRAVAAEVGAPSGSIYHRFAGRPELLARTWLDVLDRFQAGYLTALQDEDPVEAAVAAARYVVQWSSDNPADATVLNHGSEDFGAAQWPAQQVQRLEDGNRATMAAIRGLMRRLGARNKLDRDRVLLAVLDVPYGLVRRYLRADGIPRHADRLTEQTVRALLAEPG